MERIMVEKDRFKKRIYISGILTLISAGYFLFGAPPSNFSLSMIYLVSLIGFIVFGLTCAYYIRKLLEVNHPNAYNKIDQGEKASNQNNNMSQSHSYSDNPIDEEKRILNIIESKFDKGNEFKARNIFGMISSEYLNFYTEEAKKQNIYSINWPETATLELLESLRLKGILSRRVEVKNEYGDEEWYYTLLSK
jgi:hypothetical protein